MTIKDKVAIVTGASSGIGEAVARMLYKEGARVVLAARTEEKLKKLNNELSGSLVVVTDLTKEDEIKELVKKTRDYFGRVDILINNAGQGYDAPVEKINIATLEKIIRLDLIGPLILMQQVIPLMKKQGSGSIVNISSGTALMYLPDMGGYSSIKRALAGISLTAREELKDDKISVSVVYPYITDTDFEKNTIKEKVEEKEWDGGEDFKPDSADYTAGKIAEGIKSGEAEIYAHDWMKNGR